MKALAKDEVTMTTVEIAEQTGKRHYHVLRDCKNMLSKLYDKKDPPKFGATYVTKGRYNKCYILPKREILVLVSGYSIKLRAAIIDRLEELEKQMKIKQEEYKSPGLITNDIRDIAESTMALSKLFGIDHVHSVYASSQYILNEKGVDLLKIFQYPQFEVEDKSFYTTPTVLGSNVGMSAQAVNIHLSELGLQKKVKGSRGNLWALTEKGKEFAKVCYVGKKGVISNSPATQIKWNIDVLDLFK